MAESKKAAKAGDDVAKPGKSAPSGNSKSVIITNRPIMKDPMVVEDEASSAAKSEEKIKARVPGRVTVKPLSEADTIEPVETKTEDDADKPEAKDSKPAKGKTIAQLAQEATARKAAAAKPAEKSEETPDDKPAEKPEKPEEKPAAKADLKPKAPAKPATPPEETPKPSESPDIPETTDEPEETNDEGDKEASTADKKAANAIDKAADEKAAKHEATVQKLVETKQYFLPINAVEKRRSKRVVALGILLSLVLALAWADVALDAGLIQLNGIEPVTHFFSN